MNLFQNADEKNMHNALTWMNEPEQWRFTDGILKIFAPKSSDFFSDEEGPSIRDTAPFLFTNVKGDFTLTTRVDVNMKYTYDSGCLMIMADSHHWAKLCYENWMDEPSIVSVVTKEYSDDCASYKIGMVNPYLRIKRAGNGVRFYYSLDGEQWTIIRYFNLRSKDQLKVGVVAQCPIGEGCNISFDFLELELYS